MTLNGVRLESEQLDMVILKSYPLGGRYNNFRKMATDLQAVSSSQVKKFKIDNVYSYLIVKDTNALCS